MADPKGTPSKADASLREASDSTVGPGPGSSVSNRSTFTQTARKPSMNYREASSNTLSYVPSEVDASGLSVTDFSSGEEDGTQSQQGQRGTSSRQGTTRGRMGTGTQGSLRWNDLSQGSGAPSSVTATNKGKRRASAVGRERERDVAGSMQRDFSSKGRRQSRDRAVLDQDGDDEDDDEGNEGNGRYGPLDEEDDEVKRVDRGEQLVRRRMKARQRELAARKKAEKEKEKQQQLARLQTAGGNAPPPLTPGQQQPLSPRARPLSRQSGAPSPGPMLERDGRPTHINLPTSDFSAHGAISPIAPVSPGVRAHFNYPSPHSHIRRPSARASVVEPASSGNVPRRVSMTSTSNYSGTVAAPQPHRATTGTPLLDPKSAATGTDVFSENAVSEVDSSRADSVHANEDDDENDEGRDTVGGLGRDIARSDVDGAKDERRTVFDTDAEDDVAEMQGEDGFAGNDNDEEDDSAETGETGSDGDVEYTLKDRQDAINIEHPFGLPIWKPALYKKSRTVTRNAESALHSIPSAAAERHLLPANLLWTAFAGLWLSIVCLGLALIVNLLPLGGGKYARVMWELGCYLFWPYGKYVEVEAEPDSKERLATTTDDHPAMDEDDVPTEQEGESYENSFTPVAARYPHDHKHTVPFNARSSSQSNLELSRQDTIRPGDTIAAYQVMNDQNRSSGSESRDTNGGEASDQSDSMTKADDGRKGYGTMKSMEEGSAVKYTEAERVRQETDIYGYVHDENGRDVGRAGRVVGTIAYGVAFWLFIAPLMGLVCLLCWGLVFPIPMAKLSWVLLKNLGQRPLALRFRSAPRVDAPAHEQAQNDESAPLLGHKRSILQQLKVGEPAPQKKQSSDGRLLRRSRILVCTYRAMGIQYYKYTVGGVNILFINTLPFVFFTIFDFFFLEPYVEHHNIHSGFLSVVSSKVSMFVFALGSVIPLSYFIGMAVASISAQSSIGMGAVINATFGSIIEIILYGIALTQDKARLVEGSIIGSILAGVLLMPGVSMCSGAMRRKEQRFNARSAGVTSTMLIMAIIGILTPTLFYQIYGTFQLTCKGCPKDSMAGESWTCKRCFYEHVPPATDPFYQTNVKGLMYTCTVVLVLSYGIGLWFSLRTHASQIWQNAQPQAALPAGHVQQLSSAHGGANSGAGGLSISATNATGQPFAVGSVPISNLSAGQRASLYKRILPASVLQQLLPSSNRASSGQSHTVRSNQSRATVLSDERNEREGVHSSASNALPPLHLPETMSTEDYERVLGFASTQSQPPAHARNQHGGNSGGGVRRSSMMTPNDHVRQGSQAQSQQHAPQQHQQHQHESRTAAQAAGGGEEGHGGEGHGGHDAPSWTRGTSMAVLLSCTVLYAVIAEILVDAVDVVLEGSGLDLKLLGVTLFALVPNATEFMNAMSFAINGNIALSMEIGSAYALQVCLIQIPAMVVFSAFYQAHHSHDNDINSTFTLIFPRWDVIAIIFSIFLLTYTYIESRSNYFRGSLCILSYIVLISGFVFAPTSGDPEDPVEDDPSTLLVKAIGFGGLQTGLPALPLARKLQAILYSLWTR